MKSNGLRVGIECVPFFMSIDGRWGFHMEARIPPTKYLFLPGIFKKAVL